MSQPSRVRTALVTGASSGIGLEISRLLARDGARVLMVARDDERLRRAAGWVRAESPTAETATCAVDLASPGSVDHVLAWAGQETVGAARPGVDFLVNNAGIGAGGRFAESDEEAARTIVALNVVALMDLTRPVLRAMVEARAGRILNVASVAAYLPGPLMATYYASKAFVLSFSEAIAEESRDTGVTVTTLCPGPTITGFQRRAGIERARLLRGPMVMQAGPVALAGYRGALEGRRVVVPGLANKLVVQLLRHAPRSLMAALVRRANAALD
jgi:uncharacterized protein